MHFGLVSINLHSSAEPMKIIIGLGNPGLEYERTRHNVGFLCLEYLRHKYDFPDWKKEKKFKAEISDGVYLGEKIILCRPLTFMNLSGEAVIALKNFYKCSDEDILIIYDEVDLPFGKVRMKPEGSAGGQNGMKSVINMLGSNQVPRIRIGIEVRADDSKIPTRDFVLSVFFDTELKQLKEIFERIKNGIDLYLEKGIERAMDVVNV